LKELQDRGLGLAAISYDRPEILAAFSQQRGITFPLLSDSGSATIKAFGLLNASAQGAQAGIPHPGTLVLDAQGRVTSRFFEDYYVDRSTVASILVRTGADTAPVAGIGVKTEHLQLTARATDAEAAPGNRFSIVVDVTPRPGMHVYAPGAGSYKVIALSVTPQPFVRLYPANYPPSEIYVFEPLNERVPVYQKPFRLVQDVLIEGSQEAQKWLQGREAVVLEGTIDYQACDDKICYNPVSVPLRLSVKLRPLIRERPQPR
jgi:hypothetical protein